MKAAFIAVLITTLTATLSAGDGSREHVVRLLKEDTDVAAKPPQKALPRPSATPFEPKSIDEAEAILTMPEFKVTERKLEPWEVKLRNLAPVFAEFERLNRQELEAAEPSWLDSILNHPKISIFGGYNAEARAAQARARVESLSLERMLLFALAQAKTPEEKADIQSILDAAKAARR